MAKVKAEADAEYYHAQKTAEANKVFWLTHTSLKSMHLASPLAPKHVHLYILKLEECNALLACHRVYSVVSTYGYKIMRVNC